MKPAVSLAIIAASGIGLFLLERAIPLRRATARLLTRVLVNMTLAAITFGVAFIIVRAVSSLTLGWTSEASFGLLHLSGLPGQARFFLGFLMLDLGFYYWHLANHHCRTLWRFHNIHHLDPDLDVSTGFRFHFGEVGFSAVFRILQIGLIGPSAATFAAYELVFQACVLFHHSNIRLPIRIERLLNLALVTPRMHGIHHSRVFGETNSNYGTVFPWWDRLHRTLGLNIPQDSIVIGIAGYSLPADNRLWRALILPFRPQRDYWRTPAGDDVHGRAEALRGSRMRLAE